MLIVRLRHIVPYTYLYSRNLCFEGMSDRREDVVCSVLQKCYA